MSPEQANIAESDASVVSVENPWPGLLSFREADQRWFKGRQEETAELLQHVKRERLTVVFALSGLGKSSLLQAGLFPDLRRQEIFPVYIRVDYAPLSPDPTTQVLDAIAQAGAASEIKVPLAWDGMTLWEYFHNVDAEFSNKLHRRVLPLLVFDQFEEIFTLGKSADRVQSSENFLDELADLAEGTPPASVTQRWADNPAEKDDYVEEGEYKLLISLREDFLPELYDQHRRIAGVPQKRYRLRQMNGDGALLAVSQAQDLIDEAVAAQIVRYVAAGERLGRGRGRPLKELDVEPALLSVVCRELNNRRRDRGERRISADLLEGAQELVLQDFYSRSLAGMGPLVRAFVEEQLITVAGARNSVALDDALVAPGMSAEVIEQLVERRLLRKEFRRNEVRIELTHDLLTGVVRTSRDLRRNEEAREKQNKEREEAIEKQRKEREEALRELKKSRRINFGFACITGLALTAAVFAYRAQARADQKTVEATAQQVRAEQALVAVKKQESLTKEESQKKEEQTKIAEQERAKAAQKAEEAAKEATNARTQAALAKKSEARANESSAEAQKKAKEAEQAQLAEASARQAEQQRAQEAVAAQKDAEAAKSATEKANTQLVQRTEQVSKETAKTLVSEAAGFISNGQFKEALGRVARALSLDPDSMSAKSLAFDQLLRGGWRPPVNLSASGAGQFVHPALAHPDGVLFAVFSPDGRHVATTSKDLKVRLWDWQAGTSVELGSHQFVPTSASFSPDGRRLVTASYDAVRVWDVATHARVLELKGASKVASAMFSNDGRRIATASQDKTAQVWDAATGDKVGPALQHTRTVNFAAFRPDGARLVTACADEKAHVWDLASGSELFSVQHQKEVRSAVYSPDGKWLVTASSDGTARIWDERTHLPVGDPLRHTGAVYLATFSPDSKRVATASLDGTARVWETATGRPITAPLPHKGAVLSAAFSSNGSRLVTASADKTAQVWDVWYNFEDTSDLIKLLGAVGGFDGAQTDIPQLSQAEKDRRLAELRTKSGQQPATGFLRWFFAHRQ